jgi:hypothetical protein
VAARRGQAGTTQDGGEEGGTPPLTGWLVEWPVTSFLDNVYYILIEHADDKQLAALEEQLSAADPTPGETVEDVHGIVAEFLAKQRARGGEMTLPDDEFEDADAG